MRFFLIGIVMLLSAQGLRADAYTSSEIKQLKKALVRAVESSKLTDSLYTQLEPRKGDDAMITALVGTLEALKAKHAWNPYNKMKYVSMASKTMKQAIEASSQNMEIRFMRFSIQHYTPAFLGFSKNLEEDKQVIINHYRNKTVIADPVLVKNIARFMIDSKRCTSEETALLKKFV